MRHLSCLWSARVWRPQPTFISTRITLRDVFCIISSFLCKSWVKLLWKTTAQFAVTLHINRNIVGNQIFFFFLSEFILNMLSYTFLWNFETKINPLRPTHPKSLHTAIWSIFLSLIFKFVAKFAIERAKIIVVAS